MALKAFQEQYWNKIGTAPVPDPPVSRSGYPGWQVTVIGSLFGALGDWIRAAWGKARWIWSLVSRIRGLDRDQQVTLLRVIELLEHPAYVVAQASVRTTATTLGFSRPEAWKPYSHMMKAQPGRAENVFRHVRACELTLAAMAPVTLRNPDLNAIVELAYQDFALRGH